MKKEIQTVGKRKLSKSELVTNEYRERFTMWYFGIEEDIIVFISELLKEEVELAVSEERARMSGIINKLPTVNVRALEDTEGIEIRGINHTEQLVSKADIISSLIK